MVQHTGRHALSTGPRDKSGDEGADKAGGVSGYLPDGVDKAGSEHGEMDSYTRGSKGHLHALETHAVVQSEAIGGETEDASANLLQVGGC